MQRSVRSLTGIGPVKAAAFENLYIYTLRDLINHFPRAYEDRTVFLPISGLVPGVPACFEGTVASPPVTNRIRKGLEITRVSVVGDAVIELIFFNQSFVKDRLRENVSYFFYGKPEVSRGRRVMNNPEFERADAPGRATGRFVPIYPLTAGLTQGFMQKCVEQALQVSRDLIEETLPPVLLDGYTLPPLAQAYREIHMPGSLSLMQAARRRMAFEELFVFTLSLASLRRYRRQSKAPAMAAVDMAAFYGALPFEPTGAQRRAIGEITAELTRDRPLSRLLEGDVGSGKTAVAAAAVYAAVKGGYQAAVMAPTQILAEQHLREFSALLGPFGITVELFASGLTKKRREQAAARLEAGELDVAIGTHALLSDTVRFSRLGLVVADEQHRFGVSQRAKLSEKGSSPHLLVMSATPIPRTLSLIVYGELELSILDELPPGRQKVDTFVIRSQLRPRLHAFIRKQAAAGRQVYIVCPLIEQDEQDEGRASVESYTERLRTALPELPIDMVHGRMSAAQKERTMRAFAAGETAVLVSTTVIEVGVNVPNAALMIVEDADRFGLSQLHQLRGRVGRGEHKSCCVLVSDAQGETTRARLEVMCRTASGFEIAEEDLKLRGPGDFFGSRQHGLPAFKVADLAADMCLLKQAQAAAEALLERDPALERPEHAPLRLATRALLERAEREAGFN